MEYFILFFPMGILFCPLVLSLKNIKNYPIELKIIGLHLLLITIIGTYSTYLWFMRKNNLPLLHIYTMAEFSTIMLFYKVIFKSYIKKIWFIILIISFIAFCLVNVFYIQNWYMFNTYPRTLESVIVISSSLYYYYKITRQSLYIQIEKSPTFWINTGFFIYFSGSFLLFTLSNYILPLDREFNMMVWQFHALLSLILYIFIFIGLWQHKKV